MIFFAYCRENVGSGLLGYVGGLSLKVTKGTVFSGFISPSFHALSSALYVGCGVLSARMRGAVRL